MFINAVNEVKRESAFSFLTDENIINIHKAFAGYKDIEDFAKVVKVKAIKENRFSLNLPLYIKLERSDRARNGTEVSEKSLEQTLKEWQCNSDKLKRSILSLINSLES